MTDRSRKEGERRVTRPGIYVVAKTVGDAEVRGKRAGLHRSEFSVVLLPEGESRCLCPRPLNPGCPVHALHAGESRQEEGTERCTCVYTDENLRPDDEDCPVHFPQPLPAGESRQEEEGTG